MRIPLHLNPNDDSQNARIERFDLAVAAAQFNPNGARKPGRNGTSLVIRTGLNAGQMDDTPTISKRGREKRERRAQHVAAVKAQQAEERERREAQAALIARALGFHHHPEPARG